MTASEFNDLLHELHACSKAARWAHNKDLHEVWATCDRGDWLAVKMANKPGWSTRKQVVLAACACAETVLKFVPAGEGRPRLAIETACAWARGEASIAEVRQAAHAAAHAAAAAYAAYDAAYAAYDAAYDAYDAAYDAAAPADCADLVRREISEPLM